MPPEVKQCVVFLYGEEADRTYGAGTGFLVGVDHPKLRGRILTYLVTAKHCIQRQKSGAYYPRVFVRINLRTGDSELKPVGLTPTGLGKNVYVHSDPAVDLAVIPFETDEWKHEVRVIPESMMTGEDVFQKLGLGEGTDVFFTGLFTPYSGARRNYPIVRFGRVALVTPERIEWKKGFKTPLYLVETAAFGGNSGSPVFFYLGSDRTPGALVVGPPELQFAGVVTFAFQEKRNLEVKATAKPEPKSVENLGVTGVVPSYLLREILLGEELRRERGE